MMRKIAANYIFLPAYPLVKNGYVEWNDGMVLKVVDTGGVMKEIQGLEFYGGLIVAGNVKECERRLRAGENILIVLDELYKEEGADCRSLILIEGADLLNFRFRENTMFRILC